MPEPDRTMNVLFLCTGNSARSIIAEAIMNFECRGKFKAYSAGSYPKGEVHPLALALLKQINIPTQELRSKSWDEFKDGPEMDFVFTVCDNAANEVCPIWPGQPITAHWGVPDPAAEEGEAAQKAFRETLRILTNRIRIFAALPFHKLDRLKLKKHLDDIGHN